ncbi:MAG: chemotaxis protein CheW [Candidatus Sericytochromatia bacterium]|nr:chemotaxis protein CheW [Candidatus Tanganyikabacteria bacterium]
MSDIRLVFFRLGAFSAALPAAQVESVLAPSEGAPLALGGKPLHVTDARQVFRLGPDSSGGQAARVIVVRRGERRFGLRVDALGDLRPAAVEDFRALPALVERLRPTPALVAILVNSPDPVFVLDAWRLPGALGALGRVGLPVRDAP